MNDWLADVQPLAAWKIKAEAEGYWVAEGEAEIDLYEPDRSEIGDCEPMTDEAFIRMPRGVR